MIRQTGRFLSVKNISDRREAASIIIRRNDHVSGISFKITNTVRFFFAGFECKKKAISMVLADIFETALH